MLTRSILKRGFSLLGGAQKAVLPDLPYGYGDLAPIISAETMEIHYAKHHAKYVADFNDVMQVFNNAMSKGDFATASDMGRHIRFNAGGHNNHSFYWENLAPANKEGGDLPAKDSEFYKLMIQQYGSFDNFCNDFAGVAGKIQGSGWAWLAYCAKTKCLSIEQSTEHAVVSSYGVKPLLTVDVWEHAYYLEYKNLRPLYLQRIWEIVNWKVVEKRFKAAKAEPKVTPNEGKPV